eukprot:scaffold472630_cov48-Prasinocladus_malaysianus.AAC.1
MAALFSVCLAESVLHTKHRPMPFGSKPSLLRYQRCPLLTRNAVASFAQLRNLLVLRLLGLRPDTLWGLIALSGTAVPL